MLQCKCCGIVMPGIKDYDAREICEPCGGNTTEYDAGNPKINADDKERRQ